MTEQERKAKQLSDRLATISKFKTSPSTKKEINLNRINPPEVIKKTEVPAAMPTDLSQKLEEINKAIPTTAEIIDAIKNLKGNDRIDISHIRNGEQLARLANRQNIDMNDMRWHGGGGIAGGTGGATFIDQTPDNGTYGLLSGAVDGSNKVFTTSRGSYLTGDITVYRNGVLLSQNSGDSNGWTETVPGSGTFTLVTAPSGTDVITTIYQVALNTTSSISPGTDITITGTGSPTDPYIINSTLTTATEQYKIYLTVGSSTSNDYVTDGTADDVQINAAMLAANVAGGGIVYVQAGTFIIADILQIPSNVTLMGAGIDVTIIKCVNAYNPSTHPYGITDGRIMLIPANTSTNSNNIVSDITWDANVQNIPGLTSNTHHRAIWIEHTTNFRFERNKVINTINWAIYFQFGNDIWIEKNIVLGGYSSTYDQNDGIHLRNSSNFYIRGNYIDTNAGGGTSGDDAIAVLTDSNATSEMTNVIISNNIISGHSRGIYVGTTSSFNISNLNICDNQVWYALLSGIQLQRVGSSLTSIFQDITIDNNKIYNFGNGSSGYGIGVEQSLGATSFVVFNQISITNNTIRGGNFTTYLGAGIVIIAKGNGLNISNNNISSLVSTVGIVVGHSTVTSRPMKDLIVTGNRIDMSTGSSGTIGIEAFGTERGVISLNEIYGNTTGTTYGILIEANATAGNDVNGIPNAEVSAYNAVVNNVIYNVVNGIAEVNSGAAPANNTISPNTFDTVTTNYVPLSSVTTIYTSKSVAGLTTPLILQNADTSTNSAVSLDLICSTSANTSNSQVRLEALRDGSGNGIFVLLGRNGSTSEYYRVNPTKIFKLAGTAVRGTTEGTNHLDIFNGTDPVGTLANGISLYSSSGIPKTLDATGNVTTFPITGGTLMGIKGSGRSTTQTAAVASVATYTLPATDGSFEVSANVLVTTATAHSFTVTCAYTDEGNTSRTVTLNFSTIAGVISNAAITNVAGTVPYEGVPIRIRCKASTAITIATTGTFTTVTYNVEGIITQIA